DVKTEITIAGRMFELQLMPLTDRSGKPSGRIIMLYDITDLRRALDELDAYAHTVAHDLKNPLGGILSYTNYIRDELLTEQLDLDEISYSLDAIASSGNKMRAIIENLLTLASVRNQAVVEMKPLDMAEIVDNALSRLTRLIDETKVQIQQPEQWLVAIGHAPWVEEIWANYISNAIKYGGNPPILTLGADMSEDDHVRFWVQDNGRGLTATEQQQLFTKFSRLDRHREIEGHGLGLSIVRRIAHKLGGEVGVESTPDHGSRFYFTLPQPVAPAATPAATSVTSFPAL
ncbi:MAG: HAMP domain-containing histidine kinase, partial [Anaerolineales bacterium]|nr:HAMP domain-containing histidine kinase [Anaerolineales bacterium]